MYLALLITPEDPMVLATGTDLTAMVELSISFMRSQGGNRLRLITKFNPVNRTTIISPRTYDGDIDDTFRIEISTVH